MIHYFMTWGENDIGRKLSYSPAGINKARYILGKLSLTDSVTIASFASGGTCYDGIYGVSRQSVGDVPIRYCATFGSPFRVLRLLERGFNIIQMLLYVLFSTHRNDILVFYNERYFSWAMRFSHAVLHRKVIVEIEEINTIAAGYPEKDIDREIDNMRFADGYILVNNILGDYMPFVREKPNCVVHGAYNSQVQSGSKYDDGMIHVLYSGTFNRTKGGAMAAILMAEALPSNYRVHITGFGTDDEVSQVLRAIAQMNDDSRNKIIFHGFVGKDELDELMCRCHVGLCTQDPDARLNLTSFPSKIINYMSHGLVVLCGRNKAIEQSEVGDLINYYDSQTPSDMSSALASITDFDASECLDRLKSLDKHVESNIREVIKGLGLS